MMGLESESEAVAAPASARLGGLRRISSLPGPRGWPLLGNVPQVRKAHIHQNVEAWSKRYGPFFRLRLGPRAMLVVADHEAINTILRDRPEGFRRASKLREVGEEMGSVPGLFSAEGERWRKQRRMVTASFAPNHVRAYFPSLLKVTRRLQARWQKAALNGAAIDLQADLKRFTTDIIAGLAFGHEVNTLESEENLIQRHLDVVLAGVYRRVMAPFPYWRWLRLPADRQLERSNAALRRAIHEFVGQARARMEADPDLRENPTNLLEAMISAADQGDMGVDNDDVVGNVSTMLLAGEDTTANTLAWMIYLLQRNPGAWQRAKQEVDRLVPDFSSLTLELVDALSYLEACANEAMRLKPVAPFLGLEALRDTTVADIHVPAGTMVWCVLRHHSVDERYFPDPGEFDPQRWLAGGAGPVSGGSAKRIAMPFGSGPRLCPGRYLALLEIKLAMAMLLSRFEVDAVSTPSGGEAEEIMAFTMNPVGLRMRLRERD